MTVAVIDGAPTRRFCNSLSPAGDPMPMRTVNTSVVDAVFLVAAILTTSSAGGTTVAVAVPSVNPGATAVSCTVAFAPSSPWTTNE
ncbi:hypothetical protein D3C83_64140 [compost metagenome]